MLKEEKNAAQEKLKEENDAAQEKSAAILRARLPKLAEAGLLFERRTGGFFKATIASVLDADGKVSVKNGVAEEKVSRLAVYDDALPTDAVTVGEVNAKRAAAFVLDAERKRRELSDRLANLEKEVRACAATLEAFNDEFASAKNVVMDFVLPEKAKASSVSAQLVQAQNEAQKLRALLIAAGINPETGEPMAIGF